MDVVGGGGKAAGAALMRPELAEYTPALPARKRGTIVRSGYSESPMRTLAIVLGLLTALGGLVWIAQGLNLSFAPHSFMTADRTWIVLGAVAVAVGTAGVTWGRRRSP